MTDRDEAGGPAAWTAVAMLLVASLAGAVVLAEAPFGRGPLEEPPEPRTVTPVENGTELWPYTSRRPAPEGRTLGINLVVVGDTGETRRAMVARSELEWNGSADGTPPDDGASVPERRAEQIEDDVDWGGARGAARYTRVTIDGEERWMRESYQLHAGTYLGQRLHVRAYEDPADEWTAMQAHTEHWDWFRLRHTVTGISEARVEVERDFMDEPFVDDVSRRFYDNPTSDGDGWVTTVRLALLLVPFAGLAVVGRFQDAARHLSQVAVRHHREAALGTMLFSIYLGVRLAGIGLETLAAGISPKLIAAPLYLVLAGGLPAVAVRVGRGSDPVWAFAHAVGGLGTAFFTDLVLMGVAVVPLRFALHRLAVVLTVALLAAGSAAAADDGPRAPLLLGLIGWLLALALPLFGYI